MKPDRLKNFPLRARAAARTPILTLLALLLSLAQTLAEVRTDSSLGSENGRASVVYTTGGGVTASQSGTADYSYVPTDGLAGHQFFSQDLSIAVSPVATHGTADLTHGVLRAYAVVGTNTTNIGIGIASSKMQFLDTLTFSNATGQPATITINWKVEGSLNVTEGSFMTQGAIASHADYQTELRFDGPGLTAIFDGLGIQENDPSHDSTSTSATGWQT